MKHCLLSICLLAPFAAHSDIYKWIDETGQIHYGAKPTDYSAKRVFIPKHEEIPAREKLSDQQRLENVKKWVNARKEERDLEKQRKAEERKIAAQKKKECGSLKNDLKDRELGGIVWYEIDKNGERKFFSDEEIEKDTSLLRKQIKNNCG